MVVNCSGHAKATSKKDDKQPLGIELQQEESDGLLEVDEEIFSQGCERFVPTMVKKYEGMAAAAEARTAVGNKPATKQTTHKDPGK